MGNRPSTSQAQAGGGAAGGGLDAVSSLAVEASAQALNCFAPLLAKAVAIHSSRALVRDARANGRLPAGPDGDDGGDGRDGEEPVERFALERPPPATEALECGWLWKLGEVNKAWRRRYFVVAQAAGNFAVYYFEKEEHAKELLAGSWGSGGGPAGAADGAGGGGGAAGGAGAMDGRRKAKGCILLCGHTVRSVRSSASGASAAPMSPQGLGDWSGGMSPIPAGARPSSKRRLGLALGSGPSAGASAGASSMFGGTDESQPAPQYANQQRLGGFCLCLEPLDRRRRWFLRCDSEEARQRWKLALRHAALNCRAPCILGVAFPMPPPPYDAPTGAEPSSSSSSASSLLSTSSSSASALAPASSAAVAGAALNSSYAFPVDVLEREGVLQAAVEDAYGRARLLLGLEPYFKLDRSDGRQQFAALAVSACEHAAVLLQSQAKGGSSGDFALPPAVADRIALAVAEQAFPALSARVQLWREPMLRLCAANIDAVAAARRARTARLRTDFGSPLRRLCDDLVSSLAPLLLGAFHAPLLRAHERCATALWVRLHEVLDRGLREVELRQLFRDCEWQNATLAPALRELRLVTRGGRAGITAAAAAAATAAPGGGSGSGSGAGMAASTTVGALSVSEQLLQQLPCTYEELVAALHPLTLWEVESHAEQGLRHGATSAIYSFVLRVESSRGAEPIDEAFGFMMRGLLADSKLRVRSALRAAFSKALSPRLWLLALRELPELVKQLIGQSVAGPVVARMLGHGEAEAAGAGAGAAPPPFLVLPAPASGGASIAGLTVTKRSRVAAEAEVAGAAAAAPGGVPDLYQDLEWDVSALLSHELAASVERVCGARFEAQERAALDGLGAALGFAIAEEVRPPWANS